MFMPSFLALT